MLLYTVPLKTGDLGNEGAPLPFLLICDSPTAGHYVRGEAVSRALRIRNNREIPQVRMHCLTSLFILKMNGS